MKILRKIRKVYYFGYGTEKEIEMITSITGKRPKRSALRLYMTTNFVFKTLVK